jgi:hypothetical protein
MAFEQVYRALEVSNPRVGMLRAVLPEAAEPKPDDRILLLVRDRTIERAMRAWLMLDVFAGRDWLSSVDVVACGDYSKVAKHRYATAIVNGLIPRRYRWILGGALAAQVIYLAYPREVDGIERQLQSVYGEESRKARAKRRHTTVIGGKYGPAVSEESLEAWVPDLILTRPPRSSGRSENLEDEHRQTSKMFEGLSQALEELSLSVLTPSLEETPSSWEDDSDDEDTADHDEVYLNDVPVAERVKCLRMEVESRLHGMGSVWLPVDGLIETIRPDTGDNIQALRADQLHAEDVIVCLDMDGRLGLFERMLELAADQPEMRYLTILRQSWIDAMQSLAAQFEQNRKVDYSGILQALQANGAKITSEITIRNWVSDQSIGPDHRSSIEAVGAVIGSEALVQHARELDRAFRRIRGIHQGLGRRLSGVIRRSFKHVATGENVEMTDNLGDHLSLPLNELLETIDLAKVVEVNEETSLVPSQWTRRWRHANLGGCND